MCSTYVCVYFWILNWLYFYLYIHAHTNVFFFCKETTTTTRHNEEKIAWRLLQSLDLDSLAWTVKLNVFNTRTNQSRIAYQKAWEISLSMCLLNSQLNKQFEARNFWKLIVANKSCKLRLSLVWGDRSSYKN